MLKETIKKQMVEAMKAKDKQKKDILALITSEITRVEMDKKAKLVTEARKKVARETNIDINEVVLSQEVLDEINEKALMTEEEEVRAIEKMVKSTNETISVLEGKVDKAEALEKAKTELEVYMQFLPKQMTEDEIKDTIEKVLKDLGIDVVTSKDKGRIMKELMPLVKGKADGKIVNQLLREYLK